MKEKRSALMVCCLILLALLLIASLFVASSALFNVGIVTFLHDPARRFALRMYGVINLLNALACAAGIVHLLRGRGRKAAPAVCAFCCCRSPSVSSILRPYPSGSSCFSPARKIWK